MKQSTPTETSPLPSWKAVSSFVAGGIALGFFFWYVALSTADDILIRAGDIPPTRFDQSPEYVGSLEMKEKAEHVRPFALTLHEHNLLISFLGSDEIMEYAPDLKRSRSFHVLDGEDASLTSLIVEGDRLYATNFRTGELLAIEYSSGALLNTFGFLPDGKTRMKLFGLSFALGSIYASDNQTNQILAISTSTVPGVRDEGELLLNFPGRNSGDFLLSFPTFTAVTPDGRLLVSDAGHKEIKAFTCSGRPAHRFDTSAAASLIAPMGIAFDDLPSPELIALADSVFNPSGVYHQGRIHVVDAKLSRIKVFNSLGKYVLTYGEELRQPNGIAIDPERKLIFVADTELRSIMVYKY